MQGLGLKHSFNNNESSILAKFQSPQISNGMKFGHLIFHSIVYFIISQISLETDKIHCINCVDITHCVCFLFNAKYRDRIFFALFRFYTIEHIWIYSHLTLKMALIIRWTARPFITHAYTRTQNDLLIHMHSLPLFIIDLIARWSSVADATVEC